MRIASYNIRKAVGLDWKRDTDRILKVLSEINADVVVLQEADNRMGQREGVLSLQCLKHKLDYELADISTHPQGHGWHGNAILFKACLNISETKRIDIPSIEPRGAVSATFLDPKIKIIGVHLGLTPGMRRRQMTVIANHIKNKKYPIVIAGDFNEWKKDTGLFGPTAEMIIPGPSYHSSRPIVALDRFVLAGPVRKVMSFVHHSKLAAKASDHLPIVIDIAIEESNK